MRTRGISDEGMKRISGVHKESDWEDDDEFGTDSGSLKCNYCGKDIISGHGIEVCISPIEEIEEYEFNPVFDEYVCDKPKCINKLINAIMYK